MSDDAQSWVRPQRSWGKPQWGSLSNAGHQQWMGRLLQAPLCCLAGLKGARPECRVELGLPGSTISSQVSVLGHHRRDVGALGVESTCWESGDMDWVPWAFRNAEPKFTQASPKHGCPSRLLRRSVLASARLLGAPKPA